MCCFLGMPPSGEGRAPVLTPSSVFRNRTWAPKSANAWDALCEGPSACQAAGNACGSSTHRPTMERAQCLMSLEGRHPLCRSLHQSILLTAARVTLWHANATMLPTRLQAPVCLPAALWIKIKLLPWDLAGSSWSSSHHLQSNDWSLPISLSCLLHTLTYFLHHNEPQTGHKTHCAFPSHLNTAISCSLGWSLFIPPFSAPSGHLLQEAFPDAPRQVQVPPPCSGI